MSTGTAVCKDCPKRMSGYLPYFGLNCDDCLKTYLDQLDAEERVIKQVDIHRTVF